MYQYKAILTTTREVIAKGHTLEDVEKQILHFRREQKNGLHTHGNDRIEVFHIQRNKLIGYGKPKLIKVV